MSLKVRPAAWMDGFLNYTAMKATFEENFFIPGIISSIRLDWSGKVTSCPRCRTIASASVSTCALWRAGPFPCSVIMSADNISCGTSPTKPSKSLTTSYLTAALLTSGANGQLCNLNNLTNRKYSTSGILVGDPFNESFRVPAPGFNVFAGLSFRY